MPRIFVLTSTGARAARAVVSEPRFGPGPVAALEMLRDAVGNEARALRVDVPVAEAALPMREETLRHHQVQLVPVARPTTGI
jgi:hypothetical protein